MAVVVAIVIGVVALTSLRSGGSPGAAVSAPAASPYQTVSDLVEGVPQFGARLGSRFAPVRVTFYGDLECRLCRRFVASSGFARFVGRDVRGGHAQVVFSAFCTSTCNDADMHVFALQQSAALAAGRQSLFWQYALLFYREQDAQTSSYVNARYLTHLAEQIPGLNVKRWQTARTSAGLREQVRREQQAAARAGVLGTPTLQFRGHKAELTLASASSSAVLLQAVRVAEHGCPRHWRELGFVHCRDFV